MFFFRLIILIMVTSTIAAFFNRDEEHKLLLHFESSFHVATSRGNFTDLLRWEDIIVILQKYSISTHNDGNFDIGGHGMLWQIEKSLLIVLS